ncbi:MAG: multicomponent Na+:H+ antiporter subunit G [Rhodothermales bacterium]|jgi:multicomponent Na+:H+ antiporter subunit G
MILDIIAILCMVTGVLFFAGAAIGIVRFPDFYSRSHAAGKGDTLSSFLILVGIVLFHLHELSVATVITGGKIMLIAIFVLIASPTASHAIMDAAYEAGVIPWHREKKKPEEPEQ